MFCSKCGKQIADGETYCAHCGTPVAKKDAFEPYGQSTYDNSAQPQAQQPTQQTYQQQFQQPYGQPFQPYQQPFGDVYKAQSDISTSRILGIISIVLGLLGLSLFGWICGGIGLSMANRYRFSNDIQLRFSAQEAGKLNKIGLILTSVIFAVTIIAIIMIAAMFGYAGYSSYYY